MEMGWWLPPLPACWWRAGVNALLEPLLGGWLACGAPELCGDTLAHQTPAQPVRDPLDCTGLHNLSHAKFQRPAVAGRSCCGGEMHCLGSAPLFFFFTFTRCIEIQMTPEQQDGWKISKALEEMAATCGGSSVLQNEWNIKEGHYWCA